MFLCHFSAFYGNVSRETSQNTIKNAIFSCFSSIFKRKARRDALESAKKRWAATDSAHCHALAVLRGFLLCLSNVSRETFEFSRFLSKFSCFSAKICRFFTLFHVKHRNFLEKSRFEKTKHSVELVVSQTTRAKKMKILSQHCQKTSEANKHFSKRAT